MVIGTDFSSSVDVFTITSGKPTLRNFTITLNRTLGSGYSLFKITSSGSLNVLNMVISGGSVGLGLEISVLPLMFSRRNSEFRHLYLVLPQNHLQY